MKFIASFSGGVEEGWSDAFAAGKDAVVHSAVELGWPSGWAWEVLAERGFGLFLPAAKEGVEVIGGWVFLKGSF